MGYVSDFVIGVLSNATFALIVFVVAYVNRRWIKRQLTKWTLSGDVWWFCCDLHSVKLQSNLGRYDKVGVAIDAALRHARTLGVDKDIVAEIQALKEIDPADHPSLRGRVDAIIDRCGKLAILNQPGFELISSVKNLASNFHQTRFSAPIERSPASSPSPRLS